jgi:predicted TIM-barrel fold metal-dependent hydrolase
MELTEFSPQPALVTAVTDVTGPKYRIFDAHNHLGSDFGGGWDRRPVSDLIHVLDAAGVDRIVDLDGGWGEAILDAHLKHFKEAAPERFLMYGGVDWSAWPEHGDRFGEWAARRLEAQVRRGAQGLKIWKNLGLRVLDQNQKLVRVSDERLDPIWSTAAALKLPITIHIADPVAFFDPLDATNERFEELNAHPDWQFPSPPFPPFRGIVDDMMTMVARHPNTTFIAAHVGCYAENLMWVSAALDRCPNFYVDISERVAELGRQPYSARQFFLKYADRIVFGLDRPADAAVYRIYYRFLETQDEYFPYGDEATPRQGRWRVYGLYLPDEVLEKVYHLNAERLINGARK